SRLRVCPTTCASLPKRLRQSELEMMTTNFPAGCPSSCAKVRPNCIGTPSISKNPEETRPAATCCGSPRPVRLKVSIAATAVAENDWLRDRIRSDQFKVQQRL